MRRRGWLVIGLFFLLGCATDSSGRQTIKLPDCTFSVGGKYPLPTHCRYGGAGIPVPRTAP